MTAAEISAAMVAFIVRFSLETRDVLGHDCLNGRARGGLTG